MQRSPTTPCRAALASITVLVAAATAHADTADTNAPDTTEATTEATSEPYQAGAEPTPKAGPTAAASLRSVGAVRLASPVAIDGALDDEAWTQAPSTGGFWQREPDEGAPPEHPTEFRVLYDDEALYVGVRAHDSAPGEIRGRLTRHDTDSPSDWIMVGVDSYHDRRTSFTFGLNPAGVKRDLLVYDDTVEDPSWNAVWEGAANIDERGWTAEFRIPYGQLRFSAAAEQIWGLQVTRVIQRTREVSTWSPAPRNKPQYVSFFGQLDGIENINPPRRLELLPYLVTGARLADVDPGDPFHDRLGPEFGAGLDFQYGLTSNITLVGTVNPDFGQVEADPSEVNLSAQETFLDEKRPFFVAGVDIFKFGLSSGDGNGEQLFYTRRIGAPPRISADGDYVDQDPTTSILGAAKLSGKTGSGWSVGALAAVTGEEMAKVQDEGGVRREQVVEPLTSYGVLRVKKDLNGGRTSIGLAGTNVLRSLEGTGLADDYHQSAHAGGLRLAHRTADGGWSLDARLVGSLVLGEPEAIAATQEASQRYFQRPDADHLDYDPNRTSLTGGAFIGSLSKLAHPHVRGAVGFEARSPGFEINDLGFQRDADAVSGWMWLQLRDDRPGRYLRDRGINFNTWGYGNWAPDLLTVGANVNGWVTLKNLWGANGGLWGAVNRLDTSLLRGGPATRGSNRIGAWLNGFSDSRKPVHLESGGEVTVRPDSDSWSLYAYTNLATQARSNVSFRLGPFASLRSDDTQYVTTATDAVGADRYLLAQVEQTTVGLTARVDYTYSPTLSFQLYAQPFLAAGGYSDYKEPDQVRARSYERRFRSFAEGELMDTGDEIIVDRGGDGEDLRFERPDFNVRSLRSTAVMRWEYLPGSTVFLIWSHDRSGSSSDGHFRPGSELSGLADAEGEHVVLVKLSYWWSP
ncbi:DUF5916 domain-containing protein [Haliangium sp.]|uniref:DUF5916 domain-containing protein n=1 Tax=Haliangium sp. TaxID=2663208 RepID=UPI003D141D7B